MWESIVLELLCFSLLAGASGDGVVHVWVEGRAMCERGGEDERRDIVRTYLEFCQRGRRAIRF